MSTLNTVFTTCTSFLKFSSNIGLIGLSITLAVSVAESLGLPSLFMNPPGILPTEYSFSWYKIVSGKKSAVLMLLLITAVLSITVSSYLTSTAPFACLASSPVSIINFFPRNSYSKTLFIFIISLSFYIKKVTLKRTHPRFPL